MNALGEALQDYLQLRRGLGYKMDDAGRLLPRFVRFMEERKAKHITARLALEWAQSASSVQPAEWALPQRHRCPHRDSAGRVAAAPPDPGPALSV
jgi:hypothetical protein